MLLARNRDRGVIRRSVSEHGPDDVDAAACEGDEGLLVGLPFGALALVERAGHGACAGGDERGLEAGVQQSAVVSAWSVVVAGDLPGVTWDGCEAGEAGEPVGGLERGEVSAGCGEEVGGEPVAEPGDGDQQTRGFAVFERGVDLCFDLGELVADAQQITGRPVDKPSCSGFSDDDRCLLPGRFDGGLRDRRGLPASLPLQPRRQTGLSHPADRSWCCVLAEQQQWTSGHGVVERCSLE